MRHGRKRYARKVRCGRKDKASENPREFTMLHAMRRGAHTLMFQKI